MTVHDSLLDLVGGTPLIRMHRVTRGISARVLVKLEYLNPGGRWFGGTIVEATSGNTGIGLAQAEAVRGYRMIAVVPSSTAVEKIDILRAYGPRWCRARPVSPATTRST